MSKLTAAIEAVHAADKKAFVPYIMAGDGGLQKLRPTILKLQQLGVTAIEVGIPFTDPVADGPTIEEAGYRALKEGATLRSVLEELASFRDDITVPLVAMTYLNPILAYGVELFAIDAKEAGIEGVIVPDMPLEESAIIHDTLRDEGIDLVQLVSLTSSPERIQKLTAASEGFVYAVTVNGITGARQAFEKQLQSHFAQLASYTTKPILAGFGISTPAQVQSLGAMCNGVIVGSKIVDALTRDDWATIEALVQAAQATAASS